MTHGPYSRHLDVVTALITHLALTEKKSRTVTALAADLSLPERDVRSALEDLPAVFRRKVGRARSGRSDVFYTLHARFALRPYDAAADERGDDELPAIRPEILAVLLDYTTQRAREESDAERHVHQVAEAQRTARIAQRNGFITSVIALGTAAMAAAAAIAAALIGR